MSGVYIGVVRDGVLQIGPEDFYAVPCVNGKFYVFEVGNGALLCSPCSDQPYPSPLGVTEGNVSS